MDPIAVAVDETLRYIQEQKHYYPYYLEQKVDPEKPIKLNKRQKAYQKIIIKTLNQGIKNSNEYIQTSFALKKLLGEVYKDNNEKQELLNIVRKGITQAVTEALHGNVADIHNIIQEFYNTGKQKAFKEMAVKSFTSSIDTQALNFVSDYNFGLVQRVSDEVRGYIQREMTLGIEQGKTIKDLSKDIQRTGIDPIYNPYTKYTMTIPERARLIAATESNRAINQSRLVGYAQYAVGKVDVVGGIEKNTCNKCISYMNNSPYPIDKVPILPAHPDCIHTYAAHTEPADFPKDVDWNSLAHLTD